MSESNTPFRAGFVCFVGRPNVGKSTLMNALVGQKIAITSSKAQTTRRTIRGIVNRESDQTIIVDTPGLHRPRTLLGERLTDRVRETWSQVDVIAVCFPANEKIGPGDRFLASEVAALKRRHVIAVVTKADTVKKSEIADQLIHVDALGRELADDGLFSDIVPVSSIDADHAQQLGVLLDVSASHMPVSPPLYPDGEITDEPEIALAAELIREAALEMARDELPHSVAVEIDEVSNTGGKREIHASLIVERESQKPIVIGRGGENIKKIGSQARRAISTALGVPVVLRLHVRVLKEWQRNPRYLNRLGF